MATIDFAPFDADNHYYEALDAFTRYIPKDMAKRCMQWGEIDGKTRFIVGGKINKFIPEIFQDRQCRCFRWYQRPRRLRSPCPLATCRTRRCLRSAFQWWF